MKCKNISILIIGHSHVLGRKVLKNGDDEKESIESRGSSKGEEQR
jgi:hypothetical protein